MYSLTTALLKSFRVPTEAEMTENVTTPWEDEDLTITEKPTTPLGGDDPEEMEKSTPASREEDMSDVPDTPNFIPDGIRKIPSRWAEKPAIHDYLKINISLGFYACLRPNVLRNAK